MQIANGRFRGDCWGNYTHHNKNKGQSTVDMAVISDNLFSLTEDFKILPQTEHSDHSKIVLSIGNLCTTPTPATNKYIWRDKNREYKWNDGSFNFTKALNSPDIKSLLMQSIYRSRPHKPIWEINTANFQQGCRKFSRN